MIHGPLISHLRLRGGSTGNCEANIVPGMRDGQDKKRRGAGGGEVPGENFDMPTSESRQQTNGMTRAALRSTAAENDRIRRQTRKNVQKQSDRQRNSRHRAHLQMLGRYLIGFSGTDAIFPNFNRMSLSFCFSFVITQLNFPFTQLALNFQVQGGNSYRQVSAGKKFLHDKSIFRAIHSPYSRVWLRSLVSSFFSFPPVRPLFISIQLRQYGTPPMIHGRSSVICDCGVEAQGSAKQILCPE